MISGKALLAALPLALGGGWLVYGSTSRIGALHAELGNIDAHEREEGESYLRTLQGTHAERQLALLTERRGIALRLAEARRDRLLGVLLVLLAVLAYAFVRVAQRIGRELDEARTLAGGPPPRPR